MCFSRKKIIDRAIQHTRRNVVYPDLTSVKSVGFIFFGEPVEQKLYWKKTGIEVDIRFLCFLNGKRGSDTRTDVIYQSDLNYWRLPPDKLIRNFIELPFDILINMAGTLSEAMTYVCATSKAKFKVSYVPFDILYDLVIELDEKDNYLLSEEVIKTLNSLKKNI
jgi:hypothetical protein